jgi:hypothetical protein
LDADGTAALEGSDVHALTQPLRLNATVTDPNNDPLFFHWFCSAQDEHGFQTFLTVGTDRFGGPICDFSGVDAPDHGRLDVVIRLEVGDETSIVVRSQKMFLPPHAIIK